MKAVKFVFLCSESFTSYVVYSEFLKKYREHVLAIVNLPHLEFSNRKKTNRSLRIIRKAASWYLMFKLLTISIYKPLAALFGKRLGAFCKRQGICYISAPHGLDDQIKDRISSLQPDLIINASALILKKDIIDMPKLGVINFHGARLPSYRGAANYFWVLVNNEKSTQSTLHFVEEKLDRGEVISESPPVSIERGSSVFKTYLDVLRTGFALLDDFFSQLIQGNKITASKQDESLASVRSLPGRQAQQQIKQNGFRFITMHDLKEYVSLIRRAEFG
ncbi:hypothetical protein MJD09_14715 [bacterium]|nr:hypothetical protein [bacterium]